MINTNDKKAAFLLLFTYLFENTDENRSVSAADIDKHFRLNGTSAERHTIAKGIDAINSFFFSINSPLEIVKEKERGKNYYRMLGKPLDRTDVITLISEVRGSSTLDEATKNDLIKKLLFFVADRDKDSILTAFCNAERSVSVNTYVSSIIDSIAAAIRGSRKIQLVYASDQEKLRTITPYSIIERNSHHYIVGKCHQHEREFSAFRIDRIKSIDTAFDEAGEVLDSSGRHRLELFIKNNTDFFIGKPIVLNIIFDNSFQRIVKDRYPNSGTYMPFDGDKTCLRVNEVLGDPLLGWLFAHCEHIRTDNAEVNNALREKVKVLLKNTEETEK